MPGPKSDKIWANAVRRAVSRRLENVEGKPQKIERLADKLVEFAMDGQGWAMKEIGERLDGKPAQVIEGAGDEGEHKVIHKVLLVAARNDDSQD
jgi:hypothetical protein